MNKNLSSSQRAWLTVAGAFLVMTGSGLGGALSLFYLPIGKDLGFSQTSLGLYMSLLSLCGIVANPIMGRVILRFARYMRFVAVGGAILGLTCLLWLGSCDQLWQFYVGGIAMGFLMPVVGALYGASTVTHWFVKKRSVAISIVAVGTSIGTVLYSQVARFVIEHSGWRSAYVVMGVVIGIISLVGALLISPPPSFLGMKPYGWDGDKGGDRVLSGFTPSQALRSRSFWLFAGGTFCGSAYIMGIQQSVMPMLQVDFLMTAALAATLMSMYSIICACSKPVMGMIYEKWGISRTIVLVGSLMSAAVLIFLFSSRLPAAVIALIILGIGNMFGTVIMASYVADAFGSRANSAILGYINVAFAVGVSTGPVISGRMYDLFGSYKGAYIIFLSFCILSTLLTLLSKRSLAEDIVRLDIDKEDK